MTIKEILERLKSARAHAGLSCSQVKRLIDLWPISIELIEQGAVPLEMEHFLKLCELYAVSEIWVMTGVNPYFDPKSVFEAAEYQGVPPNELGDLLEALAMQRQDQETRVEKES